MNEPNILLPKHSNKKQKGIDIDPNILLETIRINLPKANDSRHYKLIREASNAYNAFLERYSGFHYGITAKFEILLKESKGNVNKDKYIVEHAIPLTVLVKKLQSLNPDIETIGNFFQKYYHIYCVTKDEDQRLNKGFKDKMPNDIDWDKNPLARYENVVPPIQITYSPNKYLKK